MPPSVARAKAAAAAVEIVAWVILGIGVLAGLVIASQTEYSHGEHIHPYIGTGIGLVLGIALNCLLMVMVSTYIKAKMELAQRAG